MGRPKKANEYIDNDELKNLVTEYVRLNYNDHGEWIERYESTMMTRCLKKPERWPAIQDFINRRRNMYKNRQLSDEDIKRFDKVANDLVKAYYKIAEGVIISMHLVFDEEVDDMKNEAVMAGLKYCNRFDETANTSCFAFITETLKNAILLFIKRRNAEYNDGMVIPEYKLFDTRSVDELKESE